jgi:glycosyltransferase involved in cell wall biosynthesis
MNLVGMMWNRNEGDILEETLTDALRHVDSIFVADDWSTDGSWDIIQSVAKAHPDKVEYIQRAPDPTDPAQRNALLRRIRERYKPEDTWVQVIESDMFILDTDIRRVIKDRCADGVSLKWTALNGVRAPGTWKEVNTYPVWNAPIREILNRCHFMEKMHYTWRPLPNLKFQGVWRPWPQGMGEYQTERIAVKDTWRHTPLLFHAGYRGPTHFYQKWQKTTMGDFHSKYKSWDLRSIESVEKTVSFFNGEWNHPGQIFPASRQGWIESVIWEDYCDEYKNKG